MFQFIMGLFLGSALTSENKEATPEQKDKDLRASFIFLTSMFILSYIGISGLVYLNCNDPIFYISWIVFVFCISIAVAILEFKILGLILLLLVPLVGTGITYLIFVSLGWDNYIESYITNLLLLISMGRYDDLYSNFNSSIPSIKCIIFALYFLAYYLIYFIFASFIVIFFRKTKIYMKYMDYQKKLITWLGMDFLESRKD